jgi:CRISPR-associated protein Csm2
MILIMGQQHSGGKPPYNPQPRQGSEPQRPSSPPPHLDKLEGWVHNGITADTIDATEKWGKELKERKFSSSQIRNVFGEIRRIEAKSYEIEATAFLLLKPKMAYAVGRAMQKSPQEAEGMKYFKEILDKAHEAVLKGTEDSGKRGERFLRFVQIMEAILAYHKAFGGKD